MNCGVSLCSNVTVSHHAHSRARYDFIDVNIIPISKIIVPIESLLVVSYMTSIVSNIIQLSLTAFNIFDVKVL